MPLLGSGIEISRAGSVDWLLQSRSDSMNRFSRILFGVACLAVSMTPVLAAEAQQVKVLGEAVDVKRFPATGKELVLYIAPGYGFSPRSEATAERLAGIGIEVWMVDLVESFFLPRGNRSVREFDGRYVAGLIEIAHKQTGKRVTLLTSSYGAIPLLRGARQWQLNNAKLRESYLNGAILFAPELFQSIPALGTDPLFEPITSATNIPIMIYQEELRNNRWQLDNVIARLKQGGAPVYWKIIPGVVGFFYEIDSLPPTQKALREIPNEFPRVIKLLASTPAPHEAAAIDNKAKIKRSNIDIELKRYRGSRQPLPLDLVDINGRRVTRPDFQGKVTVVNFWATWCPPCVHEIPSLNRLSRKMAGYDFELLSVNFGEDKSSIEKFMKQVNVSFPVLLDHKGVEAGKWNTIALPSTFVIGPDGRFAYAVNAAIEWDSPKVVAALKRLARKNPDLK